MVKTHFHLLALVSENVVGPTAIFAFLLKVATRFFEKYFQRHKAVVFCVKMLDYIFPWYPWSGEKTHFFFFFFSLFISFQCSGLIFTGIVRSAPSIRRRSTGSLLPRAGARRKFCLGPACVSDPRRARSDIFPLAHNRAAYRFACAASW